MLKKTSYLILIFICIMSTQGFCETEYIFSKNSKNVTMTDGWKKLKSSPQIYGTYFEDETINLEIDVLNGNYKVYFFQVVDIYGDPELETELACTTSLKKININQRRGTYTWKEIGTFNISDGKANVKIKSSGKGNSYFYKLKFVKIESSL